MTPPFPEPPERLIRVGFVVHVMQVAGAEVLVRETIRRLGSKIVPTVFCLDSLGKIGEELIANGVEVLGLNRRPGWDFRVSRTLAGELRTRRIEVLHAHQYTPFFYSALAKPLLRRPPKLILTEHGRHFPDVVSSKRRAVNRIVLDRLADAVNACCQFSATALARTDGFRGNRIAVIPNGIDFEQYRPAENKRELRTKLGLDPDRRSIVHVARHHPVKDQATLIRGFAGIAGEFPDTDLVLVGDGPLRTDLEKLAADLGIAGRVRFTGIQRNVPDWLAAGNVFALTSVSEAASLTLLEAMASGLPVVVTDVGGNPEIVREVKEGLLFPRGDAERCATAFRTLLGNPELAARLGAQSRQRVRELYRLESTVQAYYSLYRNLTGRPQLRPFRIRAD